MSYGQNGVNGYSNGYGSRSNRYDDDAQGSVGSSSRRNRRAGGYGGFFEDEQEQPDTRASQRSYGTTSSDPYGDPYGGTPSYSSRRTGGSDRYGSRDSGRDRESERVRERDRDRDRDKDGYGRERQRSDARTYGDGPSGRSLETVVQHINDKWSILGKNDCVPVQLAMQLMDNSSLGRGRDYDDFQKTSKALQRALKGIVNEYHQGFNSSIGTFHKIQGSISESQERVRTLRASMVDAKSNLTVTRPELKSLAATSQKYDDMLQVLDQIEKIQTFPEQLDSRISEKRFLTAVDVLQDALRMIRHSNLEGIGALADMRTYLNNQETSLTDILLEELHDHLYLKSPYCRSRWKAHSTATGEGLDHSGSVTNVTAGIRPLYRFLTSLNTSVPMVDDSSRTLEEDSFEYMRMIIEALNKMGRLEVAVERMENRLPVELFAVLEKTNQEVNQRHPAHLRNTQPRDWTKPPSEADSKIDSPEKVLNDLLNTLYSKFEAIAEGHRAVHEVIAGIVARENIKKPDQLLSGFKELWKLYQSEMRSLLHDYLSTDGNSLGGAFEASSQSKSIFSKKQRDKNKRVFQLSNIDMKSSPMATEQEELDKILQSSVPGLVSKSRRKSGSHEQDEQNPSSDSPAAGHKMLVDPSVFNITVLLPPSLVFLQRLKTTVPPDSDIAVSTLTSFLDDFLVNVFNPQFDDTVSELCAQTFTLSDAFWQDPRWAEFASKPVFKGTSVFLSLIKEFCKMLDHVPEDQAFTSLILAQLDIYHDRCQTWAEALLSRVQGEGDAHLKPAAAIMKGNTPIAEVVRSVWNAKEDDRAETINKEVEALIDFTNEKPLEQFDVIADQRTANSLCLLYSSLQWLADQLKELRYVPKKKEEADGPPGSEKANRWTAVSAANMRDTDRPVTLPLSEETLTKFDKTLESYRTLSKRLLQVLHLDIRLNAIYKMSQVYDAHYLFASPVNEPDRSILQLNADLLSFDDVVSQHLPADERTFTNTGLGALLDTFMITNASRIKGMSQHGCDRMQLNILVLQQNLKAIEPAAQLTRSSQFFDFFTQGSKALLEKAQETGGEGMGLGLDDGKVLLELCYSEALQSGQREVAAQAKRSLGEDTLSLTEYMWNA